MYFFRQYFTNSFSTHIWITLHCKKFHPYVSRRTKYCRPVYECYFFWKSAEFHILLGVPQYFPSDPFMCLWEGSVHIDSYTILQLKVYEELAYCLSKQWKSQVKSTWHPSKTQILLSCTPQINIRKDLTPANMKKWWNMLRWACKLQLLFLA
jgi:hypothetical protein